jgi:hypothetical protein
VTERLPEKNGPYLCCWKASADEKMHIARIMVWRADTGWMNAWDEPMSKYVTHWMPLPEPPKGGLSMSFPTFKDGSRDWCATCKHVDGYSCDREGCRYQQNADGTNNYDLPPTEYEEE